MTRNFNLPPGTLLSDTEVGQNWAEATERYFERRDDRERMRRDDAVLDEAELERANAQWQQLKNLGRCLRESLRRRREARAERDRHHVSSGAAYHWDGVACVENQIVSDTIREIRDTKGLPNIRRRGHSKGANE